MDNFNKEYIYNLIYGEVLIFIGSRNRVLYFYYKTKKSLIQKRLYYKIFVNQKI